MKQQHTDEDSPLAEHEERLVPQHRELLHVARAARLVRVGEADEVEDERVDDLVRQCMLLVEKHADEQRVGACADSVSRRPRLIHGVTTHLNSPYSLVG